MKKLLLLLFIPIFAAAQEKGIIVPANERKAIWLYAEMESPYNDDCKVLIVSSYIFRQKYEETNPQDRLGNASKFFVLNMMGAFRKKLDKMDVDERIVKSSRTGMNIFRAKEISAYHDGHDSNGFCPGDGTSTQPDINLDNTLSFAHQCRNNFIDQKRDEGYHVFQVEFDEYYTKRDLYDSLWGESEFEQAKDQQDKLSPLYVEVYRQGDIKNLPDYDPSPSSGSSGTIIVESAKSSSNSGTTKSSSSSSSIDHTPSQLCVGMGSAVEGAYQKALQTNSLDAWNYVIEQCDQYYAYGCSGFNQRIADIKNEAVSRQQAAGEALADIFEGLAYFDWEFKGSMTVADVTGPFNSSDVRMIFTLGKRHFRLTLSPIGYSWIDTPDFTKYDSNDVEIGEGSLGTSRFYSPSVGFAYVLYPKLGPDDYYNTFEFPINISAGGLFAQKSADFEIFDEENDSPAKEYLLGFNYFIHGSIGASIYVSDFFGFSFKAGMYYMGIETATGKLKATTEEGIMEEFTIKNTEEDINRFLPSAEFAIHFRF